jgi:beta-lactamase regulating signal transducer with metallopeptidase domain
MGAWIDRLGTLLRDAGLAAAVLTGLVALVMVGCRQPARRCVLARAALFGALAIWPLVLTPLSRVDVHRPIRWFTTPISASRRAATLASEPEKTTASFPVMVWMGRGLTLAYVSGTAAGLAWLALGTWGASWLVRRSRPPRAETQALYASLAASTARARPELLVTTRLARPVLVGVLRPVILIPAEMDQSGAPGPLRLGLLHELAHAERLDPAFTMVGSVAQAVWFFLPTLWWIRGQMQLDQEFLADHLASHGFGPRPAYASSLVEIAAPAAARPEARREMAPALRERARAVVGSTLFLRVLMLVRCPFPVEGNAPAWWRWAAPPVVGLAALAASTLSLGGPERPVGKVTKPTTSALPVAHGSFHLVRLIMEPDEHPHAEPTAQPLVLPPRLPPRYDLSFETWASATELPQIRVNGCRLLPDYKVSAGWHAIAMHRDERGTHFSLDGRPVRCAIDSGPPPARLTLIPPPHQAGLFRNLTLTW